MIRLNWQGLSRVTVPASLQQGAVGLTIPRKVYYEKEISFINSRSYGPGRYDLSYEEQGNDYPLGYIRWTEGRNFEAVVDLMAKGKLKVKPLITHRFPIEQATQAYDVITGKKKEPFLGVLLTYPERKDGRGKRIALSCFSLQIIKCCKTRSSWCW